jgi:hypothetical protein
VCAAELGDGAGVLAVDGGRMSVAPRVFAFREVLRAIATRLYRLKSGNGSRVSRNNYA